MIQSTNNYCLILAGGRGRRLWPCSREADPKQFIDFFGMGRTQLQQTYDRMSKCIDPANIFISTNIEYLDRVVKQLPEVARDHILAEPIMRNTAPSLAWANHRISHINPNANLIAVPSDQLVMNEEAFCRNVNEGLDFVSKHQCFVTMGVKPTRPEPGYGYIQMDGHKVGNIYTVRKLHGEA